MIGAAGQTAGARGHSGAAGAASARDAAALRAEVEDLKFLILAMRREVGAIERKAPPAPPAPAVALDFQREVQLFESDLIRCALIRSHPLRAHPHRRPPAPRSAPARHQGGHAQRQDQAVPHRRGRHS